MFAPLYNNLQNLSNRLDSMFLENENQNILVSKSISNLHDILHPLVLQEASPLHQQNS